MKRKNLIISICAGLTTGVLVSTLYTLRKNKNKNEDNLNDNLNIEEEPEKEYEVYEDDGQEVSTITQKELDSYKTDKIPYKNSYKLSSFNRSNLIDESLLNKVNIILKPENGRINCYLHLENEEIYLSAFYDKELNLYLTANEKTLVTNIKKIMFLPEGGQFIEIVVSEVI